MVAVKGTANSSPSNREVVDHAATCQSQVHALILEIIDIITGVLNRRELHKRGRTYWYSVRPPSFQMNWQRLC